MKFNLLNTDGRARRGQLQFDRGQYGHCTVETPAFMPVGTYGTVKGMTPEEVEESGAEILLGNTFHLWLRPGMEAMRAHGDLHDFMNWLKLTLVVFKSLVLALPVKSLKKVFILDHQLTVKKSSWMQKFQ